MQPGRAKALTLGIEERDALFLGRKITRVVTLPHVQQFFTEIQLHRTGHCSTNLDARTGDQIELPLKLFALRHELGPTLQSFLPRGFGALQHARLVAMRRQVLDQFFKLVFFIAQQVDSMLLGLIFGFQHWIDTQQQTGHAAGRRTEHGRPDEQHGARRTTGQAAALRRRGTDENLVAGLQLALQG